MLCYELLIFVLLLHHRLSPTRQVPVGSGFNSLLNIYEPVEKLLLYIASLSLAGYTTILIGESPFNLQASCSCLTYNNYYSPCRMALLSLR